MNNILLRIFLSMALSANIKYKKMIAFLRLNVRNIVRYLIDAIRRTSRTFAEIFKNDPIPFAARAQGLKEHILGFKLFTIISIVPIYLNQKLCELNANCLMPAKVSVLDGPLLRPIFDFLPNSMQMVVSIIIFAFFIFFPYLFLVLIASPRYFFKRIKAFYYYIFSLFFIYFTAALLLNAANFVARYLSIDKMFDINSSSFSFGIFVGGAFLAFLSELAFPMLFGAVISIPIYMIIHYSGFRIIGFKYYQSAMFALGFVIYFMLFGLFLIGLAVLK